VSEHHIPAPDGAVPTYLATPSTAGLWPGVVVVHDFTGMSHDLRKQANWLAGAGFLAAAPDLFHWGSRVKCLRHDSQPPASDAWRATTATLMKWRHPMAGTGNVNIGTFHQSGGNNAFASIVGAQTSTTNTLTMNQSAQDLVTLLRVIREHGGIPEDEFDEPMTSRTTWSPVPRAPSGNSSSPDSAAKPPP
jgi:dienelactone hydrolase